MKQNNLKQVLIAAMLLLSVPSWGADGDVFTAESEEGVTITFKVISEDDKTCQVGKDEYHKSAISSNSVGSLTIPMIANGYTVTKIGNYAFYECKGLTSINIPSSVTSIGDEAFWGCKVLPSITIPNSVTSIGGSAFSGCTGLTDVTINCSKVGSWFAGNTSLREVHLGDSVTTIGAGNATISGGGAFKGCTGLISINIPSSVTSIRDNAFSGCTGLTSINIPSSVTSIGGSAFAGCTGLFSITIPESVTGLGSAIFEDCTGELIINCEFTKKSFSGSLSGAKFSSVKMNGKKIGKEVFMLPNVINFEIGENVESIDEQAFSGCPSMTSITVAEGNTHYDSREGCNAIIETASDKLIFGCQNTIIPNSILAIGASAFNGCTTLTYIKIPDNVTDIGGSAFKNCSGLDSVTINCKTIKSCFAENKNIKVIHLGKGVEKIYSGAFRNCTGLISINIPEYARIYDGAFSNCSSLASICIPKIISDIETNAFSGCTGLTRVTINCPIARPWFSDNTTINELYLGEGVKSVDKNAFIGCTGLTSIVIDKGNSIFDSRDSCNAIIETASNKVVYGCQKTVIPNSVTSIASDAFRDCTSLKTIDIPVGINSIGSTAFEGCSGLTSVTIDCPQVSSCFFGSSSITKIFLGRDVNNINFAAFFGCSNLKNVYCYAKAIPETDKSAFEESPISEVTLHVPAESIEAYANAGPWKNFGNIVALTDGDHPGSEDPDEPTPHVGEGTLYYSAVNVETVLTEEFDAPTLSYVPEETRYTSSDPLVAAVLADGVVLPISEGKTIITSEDMKTGEKTRYLLTVLFPSSEGSSETVTVEEPGTLYIKMSDLESTDIKELILKGKLNAADINYIKSRVGRLQNLECLDLRDVIFVPSSEAYAQWSVSWKVGLGSTFYKYYFSDTNYTEETISSSGLGGGSATYRIYNNRMDALLYGFSTLKRVVLPRTTKGIGDYMFSGCSELISIDCPQDISFIGDEAFKGCVKLLSTNIPVTVIEFGKDPFDGCTSLVHVGDLSHMKEISANAFKGCKNFVGNVMDLSLDLSGLDTIPDNAFNGCILIHNIRFSPNLRYIGESAFQMYINYGSSHYNNYLHNLTLPEGLAYIGDGALSGFKQLEDINIPNSLERAGASTLSGTRFRENLQPDNGIYYIGRIAVDAVNPNGDMTFRDGTVAIADNFQKMPSSVSFPTSLRYIGKRAFYGSNITELILPEGFEEIAQEAFRSSKLSKCELPSSLRIIRDVAFAGCNITSITIPENVEKIGWGALSCSKLLHIQYNAINASIVKYGDTNWSEAKACSSAALEKIIVGGKVQNLPQNLFSCKNLLRVEFDEREEGVPLRVEYRLFYDCSKLISCPLPKGTTYIGKETFWGCSSLPSDFIFPEGLKEIGEWAFGRCTSFTKVILPEGLVKLDDGAFMDCTGITEMDLPESLVYLGSKILGSYTTNFQIHTIRINSIDLDRKCGSSFSGLKSLTRVEIGPKVKNLISGLFSGCVNLETIEIADERSLEYIGSGTFGDINNYLNRTPWLSSKMNSDEPVYIGRVLLTYANSNNYQDTRNTTAVIPEGTVCLGGNSLYYFRGDSVVLPSTLRYIAESAAESSSNLNTIVIPEGVKELEKNAFRNCDLKSIYLPSTLETIETGALYTKKNSDYTYRKRDSNLDLEIYSKATVPPVWEDDYGWWEEEDLSNCKVFVPRNSMYEYDASGVWGLFNIYPYPDPDQDYIDTLPQLEDSYHQPTDSKWYDLQGRSYGNRPNKTGIYIYKGKKVLIR